MSSTFFTGEDDWDCPLCMEEMDLSDKNFRPCPCGYQVCRFCWHKIREDGNERCPACRKTYNEDEAEFTPVPQEEINRMKQKKRAIREKRDAAAAAELDMSPAGQALTNEIINSRRHLSEFRVIQRNLVYVIGISAKIAHEHILKESEFFGQFGKIIKIVVNKKNFLAASSNSNPPSASSYITFARKEDAARAIDYVDGSVYDDRVIRATYGTTKYCSYFLRGLTCQNPGCMYLHEQGEEVSSFTKDQLSTGTHNLHSFIVDKNESAHLKQFGTIMTSNGPSATASTPVASNPGSQNLKPSIAQPPPVPSSPAPPSLPSRSASVTPVQNPPSAPPGLATVSAPVPLVEDRVPLINELSTNSFFDKISKMVTVSELEEFATLAPRGLSFLAPRSPPPPPPMSSTSSFGFFNLSADRSTAPQSLASSRSFESTSSESRTESLRSSQQSFSFSNLPIRSPKPPTPPSLQLHHQQQSAQPPSFVVDENRVGSSTIAPSPVKGIPVESLFPTDYRPPIMIREESTAEAIASATEHVKRFTSAASIGKTTVPVSSAKPAIQPQSPSVKITIAGRPIAPVSEQIFQIKKPDNLAPAHAPNVQSKSSGVVDSSPQSFTNRNVFDILQSNGDYDASRRPMALDSSSASNHAPSLTIPKIGNVKVVSAHAIPPQSVADLERLARENKLEGHLSNMEETMFRSRMEAESLEAKLKLLFEATAQASKRTPSSSTSSASGKK